MPLYYHQTINTSTQLAIWKIEESESFFLEKVPLQSTITHPHKRLQHLAGRYLLQYLFPDFPIHAIQIADTRKPFLHNEQYHFSISHCGNYAAAIVSSHQRVGVDIELERPVIAKIAYKFLHDTEQQMLQPNSSNYYTHLTILWSAKEAIFKWWGNGEVDFSEMMHIQPFEPSNKGLLLGSFIKNNVATNFTLEYQLFNDLCLVWLATDAALTHN
ncbi:MAG: 4'-phosphopantetheinyl transferase family protein [Chitinophagaceae bacterium]